MLSSCCQAELDDCLAMRESVLATCYHHSCHLHECAVITSIMSSIVSVVVIISCSRTAAVSVSRAFSALGAHSRDGGPLLGTFRCSFLLFGFFGHWSTLSSPLVSFWWSLASLASCLVFEPHWSLVLLTATALS